MEFGAYIRKSREAKAGQGTPLSLTAFAKILGIDKGYLSKIEQGKLPPPSEVVISKIAVHLGEDADRLLALAGKVASDVTDAIVRSNGNYSEVIRKASDSTKVHVGTAPKPMKTKSTKPRKKRLAGNSPRAFDEKGSRENVSWKIRDPFEETALPRAAILEIQIKYGFDDLVTAKLWEDIECAMLKGILWEPEGEMERSKTKANIVLENFEDDVIFAEGRLKRASEGLAEIYFIDRRAQAAEDNRYLTFSRQLEAIRLDLELLKRDLTNLKADSVEPILNEFADGSFRRDFRRERVSAAVFEALVVSGYKLTFVYSARTEAIESIALNLISDVAEHIMDPYTALSYSTIRKDWQNWKKSPSGQRVIERARQDSLR